MSWLRSKKEPAASIVSAKSSSSSMPPMYTPIGRNSQGLDKYTLAGDTMPDPLTKYEPKKEGDNSASGAPDAPQEIAPQSVYGDVDKFKHLLPDETKPYNGTITRISSGSIMSKIPNFANSTSINKSVKSIQLNSYGTPAPADVKKTSGLPVPNPYDSAKPTEKQNSSGSMGSNPFGSANPRDRRNSSGYRGPFGPPRSTGIRNPPGSLIPRPFSSIRDHVSIGSGPFNHGKPTDRRGASVSAKPPMQGPKVIIITKPSSANPLAEKKESAFDSRRGCPSGFGWLKIPGGYMCQEEEHAMTDKELEENKGAVRFRCYPEGLYPGIYPDHWLGPYYFDERSSKHGIWRYGGPLPKAQIVPDSFVGDKFGDLFIWSPVLQNFLIAFNGLMLYLTETVEEFERGRYLREAEMQTNLLFGLQMGQEVQRICHNTGSGFQGRWDQPH